ncbi:MAG TPA: efflux RND transporter periplasmic adaptor subunit [Candidatus Paceibacterota bacterium]
MKTLVTHSKRFITPAALIAAAFVIATIALIFAFWSVSQTHRVETITVTRGSVSGAVETTGTVAATESVDLAFQRGGTIASIPVDVGSRVSAGQTLATLSNADLVAARDTARANLAVQQAKLADVEAGARPEELATARIAVAQAIQSAYIAADNAVHNTVDQFIGNPRTIQPTLVFSTTNAQISTNFLTERVSAESLLSAWHDTLPSVADAASSTDLVAQAQNAQDRLNTIGTLLDTASVVLTQAIPTNNVTAATIASYQVSVGAARSAVSTALSALNTAAGRLALDEAGSTSSQVAAQEAAVDAARASLDAAQVQLAQTVLSAPIGGTVVRQDGNVGEVVAVGQSFLSLNSDARFEIKALVSEVDMAKVKIGQNATVRLDAYPGETFAATVVAIDPAATIQNGASAYKVTVQFTDADPRIKAGLTANLSIDTGSAQDALVVPKSAIITQGAHTYVIKQNGDVRTLVPVTTGIEDAAGNVQILSGLNEGDQIAAFGNE